MLLRKCISLFISIFLAAVAISAAFTNDLGDAETTLHAIVSPTPASGKPPYSSYKGIALGAKIDDVRAKLGNPKETTEVQDFFVFSSNESAQFYFDAAKLVTAITVTYTGKLEGAPTAKEVFGEDVEAASDGGITKMVRYPKAGYWISYIKVAGDDPLVMVAMQKM